MDASKNNKAFLKSRMREAAQKREKRIESPLVRYNELGQPVCKVCNAAVKSEALWPAHLASRQHKEAVDKLKAQAKGTAVTSQAKGVVGTSVNSHQLNDGDAAKTKTRVSSSLPDDFWDQPEAKRASNIDGAHKDDVIANSEKKRVVDKTIEKPALSSMQPAEHTEAPNVSNAEVQVSWPAQDAVVAGKSSQGSLPEGFFDNIDADYRARGLEPPKYDIQDEWKEFQKSIRDDIQEVELRMEEEEFDAAEDREQYENLQQRELLDRLERFKRKEKVAMEATEITQAIAKVASKKPLVNVNLTMADNSSSDYESEGENALLDWRAKQF